MDVRDAFFDRPLKIISLPDEFCKQYGDRNWIKKQYGLDIKSIIRNVIEWDGAY